jgi:hypothetical protein
MWRCPYLAAGIYRIDDPLFAAANQFEVSVASEATPLNERDQREKTSIT